MTDFLKQLFWTISMTVFDLPSDYEPNYLNNQIQAAIDNCDVCGAGGLAGDINNDNIIYDISR